MQLHHDRMQKLNRMKKSNFISEIILVRTAADSATRSPRMCCIHKYSCNSQDSASPDAADCTGAGLLQPPTSSGAAEPGGVVGAQSQSMPAAAADDTAYFWRGLVGEVGAQSKPAADPESPASPAGGGVFGGTQSTPAAAADAPASPAELGGTQSRPAAAAEAPASPAELGGAQSRPAAAAEAPASPAELDGAQSRPAAAAEALAGSASASVVSASGHPLHDHKRIGQMILTGLREQERHHTLPTEESLLVSYMEQIEDHVEITDDLEQAEQVFKDVLDGLILQDKCVVVHQASEDPTKPQPRVLRSVYSAQPPSVIVVTSTSSSDIALEQVGPPEETGEGDGPAVQT